MSVNPGVLDVCNDEDDDCDTTTDEGCARRIEDSSDTRRRVFRPMSGSGSDDSSECPNDSYLVGMRLHVVEFDTSPGVTNLHGIEARCHYPRLELDPDSPSEYEVTTSGFPTGGSVIGSTSIGSATATLTVVDLECPEHTFVTRIFSGGFEIECAPLVITGSQGAYGTDRGSPAVTVGESHSGDNPGRCPAGWLFDGLEGSDGGGVPAIREAAGRCRELEVALVE